MADSIYKQMSRAVAADIDEPLRETMIARNIMFYDRRYTGLGISNIQTPSYADLSTAKISYDLPDGSVTRDKVVPSMAETRMVTITEAFQLPRGEFEAFRDKGIMMDTANALSASERVIQRENGLILKGWYRNGAAYTINGLAEGEGTNEVTVYDFATYGYALRKVALAKAALAAAGVFSTAYHLLLNPTQYGQLDGSVSTTGSTLEMTQVKSALNPNGGNTGLVLESSDISAGFGLLLPYDARGKFFRAYMPYDTKITFGYDPTIGQEISPIYGTVIERIGLHIAQSTAICKLSNI